MKRPPIVPNVEEPSTTVRSGSREAAARGPLPVAPSRPRRIVRLVVGRRAIELAYHELR